MATNIYTTLGIDKTKLKRDYVKNPLKITINGVGSEKPYREDLKYLYITLNISLKNIQSFFKVSEATVVRWNRYFKIVKDPKQKHINTIKTFLEKYNVINNSQLSSWKQTIKSKSFEIEKKKHETLKKRNLLGKSREEKHIYELLLKKFTSTIFQYKSEKYPWRCDFYIPEIDTYIEYQGYWKHGKEPYINSKEHQEIVKLWESRAKEINWKNELKNEYLDAIYRWTINDVEKRNTAKNNKLKWFEFFNMNEFIEWYNNK